MAAIVPVDDSNEILLNNPFYNDLGKIMENPEFKAFFDKYFSDKHEIKSTVLYMKLYREIQIKYKDKMGEEIDRLTTIHFINCIMTDPSLRRTVVGAISNHYSDETGLKRIVSETMINKKTEKKQSLEF